MLWLLLSIISIIILLFVLLLLFEKEYTFWGRIQSYTFKNWHLFKWPLFKHTITLALLTSLWAILLVCKMLMALAKSNANSIDCTPLSTSFLSLKFFSLLLSASNYGSKWLLWNKIQYFHWHNTQQQTRIPSLHSQFHTVPHMIGVLHACLNYREKRYNNI